MVEVATCRDTWLASRREWIGASEVAAILGCGYANQSPLTVWESKVFGERDEYEEQRLRIGTIMEPVLLELFRIETGMHVERCGYTVRRHSEHPWLGATLDAVALESDGTAVPVEAKNVGYFRKRDWEEEPPLQYLVQLQAQLAVTGAPHGYLFALIGGNETSCKRINRNDRFISAMLDKLTEFWGYVERKELPPVDSSEATAKALARIYPEDLGEEVLLPADADVWCQNLEDAKRDLKAMETAVDGYSNLIKAAIGEASVGVTAGGVRYSWKKTKDRKGYYVEPKQGYRVLKRMKG